MWEKHYFVLSRTHLTYGIPQEEVREDEADMQDDDDEITADAEEIGEEEEWCVSTFIFSNVHVLRPTQHILALPSHHTTRGRWRERNVTHPPHISQVSW
jgi:hypothetical protein